MSRSISAQKLCVSELSEGIKQDITLHSLILGLRWQVAPESPRARSHFGAVARNQPLQSMEMVDILSSTLK